MHLVGVLCLLVQTGANASRRLLPSQQLTRSGPPVHRLRPVCHDSEVSTAHRQGRFKKDGSKKKCSRISRGGAVSGPPAQASRAHAGRTRGPRRVPQRDQEADLAVLTDRAPLSTGPVRILKHGLARGRSAALGGRPRESPGQAPFSSVSFLPFFLPRRRCCWYSWAKSTRLISSGG